MKDNHISPWSVRVQPVNADLLRLLGSYTPPNKVKVGLDQNSFTAGWNAAVRYMREHPALPGIHRVIFNGPATIVYWDDGSKTVVKCQPGDTFSAKTGLKAAMLKRFMGNDNTYNKVLNHWLGTVTPQLPAPDDSPQLTDGTK